MIQFVFASPMPSYLNRTLMRNLGRILGTALRLKGDRTVGVRFVSEPEIQRLNRAYRKKNKPTDVLSFPVETMPGMKKSAPEMGDVVIAPTYAHKEARRRSIERKEEIVRLLVHGTLHLFGFDHATEREELRMFRLQERCVEQALSRV